LSAIVFTRVNYVTQIEIYTTGTSVSELTPFEVKITTEKISGYKSQGTDQICTQLIQPDGKQLYSEIHELPSSIWNKVGHVVA
jgi:hypothetical protein